MELFVVEEQQVEHHAVNILTAAHHKPNGQPADAYYSYFAWNPVLTRQTQPTTDAVANGFFEENANLLNVHPMRHELHIVRFLVNANRFLELTNLQLVSMMTAACVMRTIEQSFHNQPHANGDYLVALGYNGRYILLANQVTFGGWARLPIVPNIEIHNSAQSGPITGNGVLGPGVIVRRLATVISHRINALFEAWAHHPQGASANGRDFLINELRVMLITKRLPAAGVNAVTVGCKQKHTKLAAQYPLLGDATQRVVLYSPYIAGSTNLCLLYPFLYPAWRGKNKKHASPNQHLLELKTKVYLKLGYTGNELNNMVNGKMNAADPKVLLAIMGFCKMHCAIFMPSNDGKSLQLVLDTRRVGRGNIAFFGAHSYEDFGREVRALNLPARHVSFAIIKGHVYPVLSDPDSEFNKAKTYCRSCFTTYEVSHPHECNAKLKQFHLKILRQNSAQDPGFLHYPEVGGPIKLDSDGLNSIPPLESLTCAQPMTSKEVKFGDCPFSEYDHFIYFDLEVFFPPWLANEGRVYAVGLFNEATREYRAFYGPESLPLFMDYLSKLEHSHLLISYNGSRFDNIFLAEAALQLSGSGMTPKKFMLNAGSLLGLELHYKHGSKELAHRVWDLCKFTMCPLSEACKSFGCEVQKSFFPHLFIKEWADLQYIGPPLDNEFYPSRDHGDVNEWKSTLEETHVWNLQEECLRYLSLDVMSMREIHQKLNAEFNAIYEAKLGQKITVTKYVSLSQLSLALCSHFWQQNDIPIHAPSTVHSYDVFRSGYIGGRVEVGARQFKTEHYERVKELHNEEGYRLVGDDYLQYEDFTSLYPFVMEDFYFPFGQAHFVNDRVLKRLNLELCGAEERSPEEQEWHENHFVDDEGGLWSRDESSHSFTSEDDPAAPARARPAPAPAPGPPPPPGPAAGAAAMVEAVLPYFETSHDVEVFTKPDFVRIEEFAALPFWEKFVCAYWEVSYEPPKNLRYAYTMYKAAGGRLQSDLHPNRQWLYMPDFLAIVRLGYKIKKIHRCILFEGFGRILRQVIQDGKSIKEEGARLKNEVKKKLGKLFLNSLYGKFGQGAKDEVIEFIDSLKALVSFTDQNIWTDLNIFDVPGDGAERRKLMLAKGKKKAPLVSTNKPTYLAGMVTALSRYHNRMNMVEQVLAKNPAAVIYYHDTDSFLLHRRDALHIPERFLGDKFGQLKDELASNCKSYAALKTDLPVKIIRLIALAKKCYLIEYILPNGVIETTSTVKGITCDISLDDFEKVGADPHEAVTFDQEDTLGKTMFAPEALDRKRKRAQVAQDDDSIDPAADEEDGAQPASFTIHKRQRVTRSINKTAYSDKHVLWNDPLQRTLPHGHELITPVMAEDNAKRFAPYQPQQAKRYGYKSWQNIVIDDIPTPEDLVIGEPELAEEEFNYGFEEEDIFGSQ